MNLKLKICFIAKTVRIKHRKKQLFDNTAYNTPKENSVTTITKTQLPKRQLLFIVFSAKSERE